MNKKNARSYLNHSLHRLLHIGDDSVRNYQQDEVLLAACVLLGVFDRVPDNRLEVGWSTEGDLPHGASVRFEKTFHATAVAILRIEVEMEAMRDLSFNDASEAKARVQLVTVVILDDLAHSDDG